MIPTLDAATAILLGLSALLLAAREQLLSPSMLAYPKAPQVVRLAIFTMALGCAGTAVLFWLEAGRPGDYAGLAALPVLGLAAATCLYQLGLVYNVARQRYRPQVWARLHRAADTVKASCGVRTKPVRPAALHVTAKR